MSSNFASSAVWEKHILTLYPSFTPSHQYSQAPYCSLIFLMVLIWRTCSTIKGFLIWFIPVTLMFDHVIRCWSPLGVKGLTLSFKGEVFTFNNQLFRSGNKVKAITSGVPYNFSLLMQCEMQWKEQNSIFLFYKNWILFLLNHDERLLHEISDLHWIYYRLIAELTKDHWKHQKNARHHQK